MTVEETRKAAYLCLKQVADQLLEKGLILLDTYNSIIDERAFYKALDSKVKPYSYRITYGEVGEERAEIITINAFDIHEAKLKAVREFPHNKITKVEYVTCE